MVFRAVLDCLNGIETKEFNFWILKGTDSKPNNYAIYVIESPLKFILNIYKKVFRH